MVVNGLVFNKAAVELLGKPEYIAIGLDKENKRLAIVGVDENYIEAKYPFANTDAKQKRVVITATLLRRKIRDANCKEPERGGTHYAITLEDGCGIVDLGGLNDE